MSSPFDSTLFPDGSQKPIVSLRNVRKAEAELAIANEAAAQQAHVYVEQARLAQEAKRFEDIQRGEKELAWLRQQSREAHRLAGDDTKDRLRAAFVESQRREAERLGIPFSEPPAEEPIAAPEPPNLKQGNAPSFDADPTANLRKRFERAVMNTAKGE